MSFKKRALSLLLSAAILCNTGLTPVFAYATTGETPVETSSLCEHHPAHTAECGYTEGTAGEPCTHTHTKDCYSAEMICGFTENVVEGGGSGASHTQDCYKLICPHANGKHDTACGYIEKTTGTPCAYECLICKPETPALKCDCTVKCTLADEENGVGESINVDCPVCATKGADLSVCVGAAAIPMMAPAPRGTVIEQFTLATGQMYYFDLSSEISTIGTINTAVPDTTLHYVPFTYAGTVNAYSLYSRSADDDTARIDSVTADGNTTEPNHAIGYKSDRSLFVADYNVSHSKSWDDLNTANLIFGKPFDTNYKLRSLSVGSIESDTPLGGSPTTNEWDNILGKSGLINPIKNWNNIYSWGQDTSLRMASSRALRGYSSAAYWRYTNSYTNVTHFGWRPALEVLNPATLGSDGLKAVALNLNGGSFDSNGSEADGVVNTINIVCAGDTFTAPSGEGLSPPSGKVFDKWQKTGDTSTTYATGDTITHTSGLGLTAQWTEPAIAITASDGTTTKTVGGDTLSDAITNSALIASAITKLTVTGGIVTADDWKYFTGGTPGTSTSPFTALTDFTVADTVTSVAAIPNGTASAQIFPKTIVNVTIPKVTTIGDYAFEDCNALTTANFPQVASIGRGAFNNCASLTNTTFPVATSIGENAFSSCSLLTIANFPEVITIDINAFNSCSALTTANFPVATSINKGAFHRCQSLENTTFPKAQAIGNDAFLGCTALKSVNFPEAIIIGEHAFSDCAALKTANFPVVTTIGATAFYNCALSSASFPKAINIGFGTFDTCTNLVTASFPEVTTIGDRAFYQCALATASFPKAISIGTYAFDSCKALKTANFPLTTDIGMLAFSGCSSMATASFPKLTSIKLGAFSNCSLLAELNLGATVPTVGSDAFYNCPTPRKLILVDASGNALTSAEMTTAQTNYDKAEGAATDKLWYGWTITTPIPPAQPNDNTNVNDFENDFWISVVSMIQGAKKGDVLKIDTGSYTKMPACVMEELLIKGAGMIIKWNGGKDIVIPVGKAHCAEKNRDIWTLEELSKMYKKFSSVKGQNQTNPSTDVETDPKTDVETNDTVDNQTDVTTPIIDNVVDEPTAQDSQMYKYVIVIVAGTLVLAVTAFGVWTLNRKKDDEEE